MFRKQFIIKSNIMLKACDKKKFSRELQERFKCNDICDTLKMEDVHVIKATTFQDKLCEIYTVGKNPWIIVIRDVMYPTVYFMWLFPDCIFSYTIHESVVPKLLSGADVMLPGLIVEGEITESSLGGLSRGAVCAVHVLDNKSAVAVGCTNLSSQDMLECGLRGKGILVIHSVGDFLWKLGTKQQLPFLPISSTVVDSNIQNEIDSLTIDEEISTFNDPSNVSITLDEGPEAKTKIFTNFFLLTLLEYFKSSTSELPVLVSTFYGTMLVPFITQHDCSKSISVQKTTFKKFSPFLQSMTDKGVLKVEERQKGVQQIMAIDFSHEIFHTVERIPKQVSENETEDSHQCANFKEMYSLTAKILPIILLYEPKCKKGDIVSAIDVRKWITHYIKANNLVISDRNSTIYNHIKLDEILSRCLDKPENETFAWTRFFDAIFQRLSPCFEFQLVNGSSGVKKGKPPLITISTARRASNKKVMLINNLEGFGIDPTAFAKGLQHTMAASATINVDSKGAQVQVQGSKTNVVVDLLCKEYKVTKSMIKVL